MKAISLDDAKKIELDLLKKFARQCDDHGLRYYLSAGTLLGAVRHRGFIPWDDDIDVMMPREDYERYYAMFPLINNNPSLSLTSYRDRSSIYPFFKLVDNRTIVYEEYVDKAYSTGIWVDIFPLDGIPDMTPFDAQRKAHRIYNVVTADPNSATTPLRKFAKTVLKPLFAQQDIHAVAKQLDEEAASNPIETGKPLGQVIWGYGPCETMPFELLETCELPFEDGVFHAPRLYDRHLTSLFGDYMTPPPEDERIPHGFKAFWREEAPYEE